MTTRITSTISDRLPSWHRRKLNSRYRCGYTYTGYNTSDFSPDTSSKRTYDETLSRTGWKDGQDVVLPFPVRWSPFSMGEDEYDGCGCSDGCGCNSGNGGGWNSQTLNDWINKFFFTTGPGSGGIYDQVKAQRGMANDILGEQLYPDRGVYDSAKDFAGMMPGTSAIVSMEEVTNTANSVTKRVLAGANLATTPLVVTSSIKKNLGLVREAQYAGKSHQNSLDHLTLRLQQGSVNPGSGSKHLFSGIHEARADNGARVYFQNIKDGIEIVGKSTKKNQEKVIALLRKLYE
jgi:hypothetical protein